MAKIKQQTAVKCTLFPINTRAPLEYIEVIGVKSALLLLKTAK